MNVAANQDQSAQDIWKQLDAEEAVAPAARPEPVEAPAPVADAAPAPEAKSEAADPYASLPESVKQEIMGLKSMVNQLGGRLRNAEGHIGGLTSQLKQAQSVANQTRAGGGEAPSAAQIAAAQGDPNAWKELEEEYPEFSRAMKSALNAQLAQVRDELRGELARVAPANSADVLERIETARREMMVEARHPGWQEKVREPQFAGWLESQPREVQMLAQSSDPRDAIRLLDLHTSASRSASTNQQQRIEAAAAIPMGRSQVARPVDPERMSGAEYWRYLDQLEARKG